MTCTLATDRRNGSDLTKMNHLTEKIFDITLSKVTSNLLDICTTKGTSVADFFFLKN
jgi:hypothetical protein